MQLALIFIISSVVLSTVYTALRNMFGHLSKDLDYVFPPIYTLLMFWGTTMFLVGNTLLPGTQGPMFALSIFITLAHTYGVGLWAGNDVKQQVKRIKEYAYIPVKAFLSVLAAIKLYALEFFKMILNLWDDIVFSVKEMVTEFVNKFYDTYDSIVVIFLTIWDSINDILTPIGDMIYNILTMGGTIPTEVLPPPFNKKQESKSDDDDEEE